MEPTLQVEIQMTLLSIQILVKAKVACGLSLCWSGRPSTLISTYVTCSAARELSALDLVGRGFRRCDMARGVSACRRTRPLTAARSTLTVRARRRGTWPGRGHRKAPRMLAPTPVRSSQYAAMLAVESAPEARAKLFQREFHGYGRKDCDRRQR